MTNKLVLVVVLTLGLGSSPSAVYCQLFDAERERIVRRHLKKENPNELWVSYYQSEDCPGSFDQVIDNEMTQSRVKQVYPDRITNTLILNVDIACLPFDDDRRFVFELDIYFFRWVEFLYVEERYLPDYGTIGYAPKNSSGEQYLTNALRTKVEEALTDFLKINFDL